MTPFFIGRYAMILSGVFPIIPFASIPTARILLSCSETATTDGSFNTTPLPGTNTRVFAVPRSIPNFRVKNDIVLCLTAYMRLYYRIQLYLQTEMNTNFCYIRSITYPRY